MCKKLHYFDQDIKELHVVSDVSREEGVVIMFEDMLLIPIR